MEKLIESIKSKDLVQAKKIFAGLMEGITTDIKAQEQNTIAKSVFVEGEETGKEDDDKADSIDDSNASKEDEDETATA